MATEFDYQKPGYLVGWLTENDDESRAGDPGREDFLRSEAIYGYAGDDRIYLNNAGSNYVDGGTGDDYLVIGNYADPNQDNDQVGVRDWIEGGAGRDQIRINMFTGAESLVDGGADRDMLEFEDWLLNSYLEAVPQSELDIDIPLLKSFLIRVDLSTNDGVWQLMASENLPGGMFWSDGEPLLPGAVESFGYILNVEDFRIDDGLYDFLTVQVLGNDEENSLEGGNSTFETDNGGQYDDQLIGLDGGDYFEPYLGNDLVDGGLGRWDQVAYGDLSWMGDYQVSVFLDAWGGDYDAETGEYIAEGFANINGIAGSQSDGEGYYDHLIGIEQVRGTAGDDLFVGSRVDNSFRGLAGDDVIWGDSGAYYGNPEMSSWADRWFDRDSWNSVKYDRDARYDNDAGKPGENGITTEILNDSTGSMRITDGYGDTDTVHQINGVTGTQFNDYIVTGDWENQLVGLAGNDYLDGGGQWDSADYREDYWQEGFGTQGVYVNLSNETQQAYKVDADEWINLASGKALDSFGDIDTLVSIEGIRTSINDDTVWASDEGTSFRGYAGDDTFIGGADNDTMDYMYDDDAQQGIVVNLTGRTLDLDAGPFLTGHIVDSYGDVDYVESVEVIRGSQYADVVYGPDAAFIDGYFKFRGGDGADEFYGGTSGARIEFSDAENGFGIVANFSNADIDLTLLESFTGDGWTSGTISSGESTDGHGEVDYFENVNRIRGTDYNDVVVMSEDYIEGTGIDWESNARESAFDLSDAFTLGYPTWSEPGFATAQLGAGTDILFADYSQNNFEVIAQYWGGPEDQGVTIDLSGMSTDTAVLDALDPDLRAAYDALAGQYFDYNGSNSFALVTDQWGDQDLLVNVNSLYGTDYDDSLTGNDEHNYLEGGSGRDVIDGGGNDDYLVGGEGDDVLRGGVGDDFIEANEGADEIDGGAGSDYIHAGRGSDIINVDDGDADSDEDIVDGGRGYDIVNYAGEWYENEEDARGDYRLRVREDGAIIVTDKRSESEDVLVNVEKIRFANVAYVLDPYADYEKVVGSASSDLYLLGTAGDDFIDGRGGADVIKAGAGEDRIRLMGDTLGGVAQVDAGSGDDVIEITSDFSGQVALTGGAGSDTIELLGKISDFAVEGTSLTVRLNNGAEIELTGQFTRDANDQLVFDKQNAIDVIRVLEVDADGNVLEDPNTGQPLSTVLNLDPDFVGGPGDTTTIFLSNESDPLNITQDGEYVVYGFDGDDEIEASNADVIGSVQIYGGGGHDDIEGSLGDDYLAGGDGDDQIWGNSGDDELIGGLGSDLLSDGLGENRLLGGEGNDFYLADFVIDQFLHQTVTEGGTLEWEASGIDVIADSGGDNDTVVMMKARHQDGAQHPFDGFATRAFIDAQGDLTVTTEITAESASNLPHIVDETLRYGMTDEEESGFDLYDVTTYPGWDTLSSSAQDFYSDYLDPMAADFIDRVSVAKVGMPSDADTYNGSWENFSFLSDLSDHVHESQDHVGAKTGFTVEGFTSTEDTVENLYMTRGAGRENADRIGNKVDELQGTGLSQEDAINQALAWGSEQGLGWNYKLSPYGVVDPESTDDHFLVGNAEYQGQNAIGLYGYVADDGTIQWTIDPDSKEIVGSAPILDGLELNDTGPELGFSKYDVLIGGGQGNDLIFGTDGLNGELDFIMAGAGNDFIYTYGGVGQETTIGGQLETMGDMVIAGSGDDTIIIDAVAQHTVVLGDDLISLPANLGDPDWMPSSQTTQNTSLGDAIHINWSLDDSTIEKIGDHAAGDNGYKIINAALNAEVAVFDVETFFFYDETGAVTKVDNASIGGETIDLSEHSRDDVRFYADGDTLRIIGKENLVEERWADDGASYSALSSNPDATVIEWWSTGRKGKKVGDGDWGDESKIGDYRAKFSVDLGPEEYWSGNRDSLSQIVFADTTMNVINGADKDLLTGQATTYIEGTIGDDLIFGTDGVNHIDAKDGNDIIFSGDGDDVVVGNYGDDVIIAGDGDDIIRGDLADELAASYFAGYADAEIEINPLRTAEALRVDRSEAFASIDADAIGDVTLEVDGNIVEVWKKTITGEEMITPVAGADYSNTQAIEWWSTGRRASKVGDGDWAELENPPANFMAKVQYFDMELLQTVSRVDALGLELNGGDQVQFADILDGNDAIIGGDGKDDIWTGGGQNIAIAGKADLDDDTVADVEILNSLDTGVYFDQDDDKWLDSPDDPTVV